MRPYSRRGRSRRSWVSGDSAPPRRPVASTRSPLLTTRAATALHEMGILYQAGAPSKPSVWQEVEALPRPVLLLLSLTCFLLLLGLLAWQPWR